MRVFILLLLTPLFIWGDEISAIYLSWYGDPATTMTIQWHTSAEEPSDEIRLETPHGWASYTASHIHLEKGPLVHTITLDHLRPDSVYRFQIGEETHSFRTMPRSLSDRPIRFIVGGDAYGNSKLFRRMNETIASQDPDFVVIGGDLAYAIGVPTLRLRSSALTRWLDFLSIWKEQLVASDGRLIPFLIVAGNHDIASDNYELFFSLFAFPQKQLYRAIDFGDYLSLFLLDTGHFQPIQGRQTLWLEKALSSRTNVPHLFAAYHIGAYPTWYPYDGLIPKTIRNHWCPLFDLYHLSVAFEHHNHAFKRTYPLKANKIDDTGTLYLGDGSWGVKPRKTRDMWYLEKKAKRNGVWLVDLDLEGASFKALDLVGDTFDEVSMPTAAAAQ